MKLIIDIVVLCFVCGTFGDSQIDIPFNIYIINDGDAYCDQNEPVIVREGQTVKLYARVADPKGIYRATCDYNNGTGFRELKEKYHKEVANDTWYLNVKDVRKDQFGTWRCRLGFNKFNRLGLKVVEGDYTFVDCSVQVKGTDDEETGRSMGTKMDVQTIAIIGGVGILVIVIIIAQTIALCYFKRKAKPRRRMDTLTSRTRFDRGDTARYSAPPSRKGNARAQADTDSHIYEMVGVNALYKESKELNQEGKTDANGRNIKNRPPLPLPDEVPDVPLHTLPRPKPSPLKSAVSTSSLISKSSTLTKKGKDQPPSGQPRKPPVRPPKQTEEDMPGSLKRPPKALPTSVAPKTGSIPKMPATDPAMLELKNMFKNRNIGNDSPAPSPTTTLEKPKIQAKPFQKPKPEEPKPIPKPIGINPLVQGPSQIRLILPKIEATLKAPKTAPNLKPVTLKKPMTSQQTSHPSTVSQLTSTSHPTPIASRPTPPIPNLTRPSTSHVPPLQSRPLPPIRASRPLQKPNEASTRRLPPDPTPDPIYQMAEEDESPQTDDDEEWTYEQLGQYNLYNI